jgi:predicted amidophosphoribosyltransferase
MEERGYNQAAIIAAEFAEKTGIVMDGEFLVREDRKMAMKDLNAMQRRLNVKDAFSVTEHGKELLDHSYGDCDDVKTNAKNILLIDDIYTTGSTVDECARVLKEAGAGRVDVLTFAAGANRVPGERAGRTARSCDN